jgi:pyruvate/2-oxoglutarate dehydrogenase complex dihydrolipoamide acyltransferase (E2) component
MKITELLVESQQLDEGPFTQAVGKVGGKIAKGVANIGKDLKTGFKAGYSGEQPPADPAAPTTPAAEPAASAATTAPTQAAPVKKVAPAAPAEEPAAEPAATPTAKEEPAAAPANDGGEVIKLQQQIKSLTTDLQGVVSTMQTDKRDMLTDISNLKQQVAKLVKPSQAEIDADRARLGVGGSESVLRADPSLSETLARKVQEQKKRMFEAALTNGQQSIFKK